MSEFDRYFDHALFAEDLQSSLAGRRDPTKPLTEFMQGYTERVRVARRAEEELAALDARLVWLDGEDHLDRTSALQRYGSHFPVYILFSMGDAKLETKWGLFREFPRRSSNDQPTIEIKQLITKDDGKTFRFEHSPLGVLWGKDTIILEHFRTRLPRTARVHVSVGTTGESVLFTTDGRASLSVETKARSFIPSVHQFPSLL